MLNTISQTGYHIQDCLYMHKTHRIYHLCLLSTVGLTLPKTQVYILNPQNMAKTSDNNHDKTPRLTMSKYSHGNCVIINLHTTLSIILRLISHLVLCITMQYQTITCKENRNKAHTNYPSHKLRCESS